MSARLVDEQQSVIVIGDWRVRRTGPSDDVPFVELVAEHVDYAAMLTVDEALPVDEVARWFSRVQEEYNRDRNQ